MELIFIPLNVLALILFGYDKLQAKYGGRRIPERILLGLGFLGGIGSLLAMVFFRHKTRHQVFWLVCTLGAILNFYLVGSRIFWP